MGAWTYVAPRIESATRVLLGKEVRPVSSAAPTIRYAAEFSPAPRLHPLHFCTFTPLSLRSLNSLTLAVLRWTFGCCITCRRQLQDPRCGAGQADRRRFRISTADQILRLGVVVAEVLLFEFCLEQSHLIRSLAQTPLRNFEVILK